ncbi:MAG: hypothetical protein ACE5GZ_12965 [Gammaproteobacteria bacterium]
MNEDHIIAAILTAGLVSRNTEDEIQPKDMVTLYELMLTELLAVIRPPRESEGSS